VRAGRCCPWQVRFWTFFSVLGISDFLFIIHSVFAFSGFFGVLPRALSFSVCLFGLFDSLDSLSALRAAAPRRDAQPALWWCLLDLLTQGQQRLVRTCRTGGGQPRQCCVVRVYQVMQQPGAGAGGLRGVSRRRGACTRARGTGGPGSLWSGLHALRLARPCNAGRSNQAGPLIGVEAPRPKPRTARVRTRLSRSGGGSSSGTQGGTTGEAAVE
jgi:hypothetical protein